MDCQQSGLGAGDEGYSGQILHGDYSDQLKTRVRELITCYRLFEDTGNPATPYLSAWREGDSRIWYEYPGKQLTELLHLTRPESARTLRDCVVERRVYSHHDDEPGVITETTGGEGLVGVGGALRAEGKASGAVEAVYKIKTDYGYHWVKDRAVVEIFPQDAVCLSLGCLADVSKEMEAEEERKRLVIELQEALNKVKLLSGMLPICAACKKIRDDQGYWTQIESYIRKHSEAQFTHGICPDCAKRLYPDL
ncbi:MAG: hypothetical protein HQK59_10270 [Deltaproteobacteria bacterium]|nr:hypothetical protein [Deltaproteobacteria bacterium]